MTTRIQKDEQAQVRNPESGMPIAQSWFQPKQRLVFEVGAP